jgi:hypothetical protein
LANHYKQNPEVFLSMPMSDVLLHGHRTVRLLQIMAREREDAERDRDG